MKRTTCLIFIFIFLVSCSNKHITTDKEKDFRSLLSKLKPLDLPFVINSKTIQNFTPVNLNRQSGDMLFLKLNDIYPAEALGYLSDTTNFYKLIYYFVGDAFYYRIAIIDKFYNVISDTDISSDNTCVPNEPGSNYCSTTIEFNKDNTIKCIDSTDNNGIDSLGNIIDSIRIIKTTVKILKIENDGKISVKIYNSP
jgi:hypothetical protein